jgi:hypothetical protein
MYKSLVNYINNETKMSLPHSRLSCFDMLVMAVLDQKLYKILMSAIYFSMMMEIYNDRMLAI